MVDTEEQSRTAMIDSFGMPTARGAYELMKFEHPIMLMQRHAHFT